MDQQRRSTPCRHAPPQGAAEHPPSFQVIGPCWSYVSQNCHGQTGREDRTLTVLSRSFTYRTLTVSRSFSGKRLATSKSHMNECVSGHANHMHAPTVKRGTKPCMFYANTSVLCRALAISNGSSGFATRRPHKSALCSGMWQQSPLHVHSSTRHLHKFAVNSKTQTLPTHNSAPSHAQPSHVARPLCFIPPSPRKEHSASRNRTCTPAPPCGGRDVMQQA